MNIYVDRCVCFITYKVENMVFGKYGLAKRQIFASILSNTFNNKLDSFVKFNLCTVDG